MNEDGMLLNFSVEDTPLKTKPIFKGGRWKDRLQAKRSLRRLVHKGQSHKTVTGSDTLPSKTRELESSSLEASHPAKRQKTNGFSKANISSAQEAKSSNEVVSSLFTSNPIPTTSISSQTEDTTPIAPSNAPLQDGASPFTSLGLSQPLANHLLTSLSLTAPTAIQKAAIATLLKDDSDAFIQAETGSGKTLAYLLPIVQRIIALSTPKMNSSDSEKDSTINRTSGLFALILAPTRELTHQISLVLSSLLRKLPRLVAGTVTGGAVKNHEKARLRKGLNILVATPGRLADHLDNTEVLDVSNVRWLVLDEGDRLMELGFEEDIKKIVKRLEDRKGKARFGIVRTEILGLPKRRITVLCSATLKMAVQKLGEISLKDAVLIKTDPEDLLSRTLKDGEETKEEANGEEKESGFRAPAQLKQSYIVAPAKQRLVTLTALLRRTFAQKGLVMKAMVFFTCADSVEFHFQVLSRKDLGLPEHTSILKRDSQNASVRHISVKHGVLPSINSMPSDISSTNKPNLPTLALSSTLGTLNNPEIAIYKLHGSMPQPIRTSTLESFSRNMDPAVMLCTDVASRGLDIPSIDLVIEYDPPFSADEHLHRVGRTARVGREGRAICFLMPGHEERYAEILKAGAGKGSVKREGAEEVLKKGFAAMSNASDEPKWDVQATDWQLEVERWVIDNEQMGKMAQKAFVSHVRAYATHIGKERAMFDVKQLHLGHLAKAFALRERPGSMGRGGLRPRNKEVRREKRADPGGDENGEGTTGKGYEDVGPGWRGSSNLSTSDGRAAARKMREKMNEHIASRGEFNIG